MTARDGFTRLVDTWLAEEGAPTTPDYLDLVLGPDVGDPAAAGLAQPREVAAHGDDPQPARLLAAPVAKYALLTALLIVLALATVVLYAGSQPSRVPPPFGPAANGRIYFDVDGAIIAAEPRRSGRRTIDVGVPAASAPYVSPDGTRIAFVVVDPNDVAGDRMLVADADGSNPRDVTGELRLDIDPTFNPTWSPDSTRLVFGAYHEGVNELFVVDADGTGTRGLGNRDAYGRQNPEWSLSGDWIAYMATLPAEEPFIAAIRPDGTDDHRLPASAASGDGFRGWQLWAPDGTQSSPVRHRRHSRRWGRCHGRHERRHRRRDDPLGRPGRR